MPLRWRAAAAAFVLALPALLVASAAAGAGSAPGCMTPGLVVWLDTQGSGAAGGTYYQLEFTNLSGHRCTLDGYPYVWALALGGARIGSVASFDAVHPAVPVTLADGATAAAVLRIADAANFPATTCRRVTAAGLRVYPPNQTRFLVVPFPFEGCSRPGPRNLSVEVVGKQ